MNNNDLSDLANIFAEIVLKNSGKNANDLEKYIAEEMKKGGYTKNDWEEENPIPKLIKDVMEILDRFDGKGAVEIEEELKDFDEYTIGDLMLIGKRLACAPYV